MCIYTYVCAYIYNIHIFFSRLFFHVANYRILNRLPVLYSRSWLVIYFITIVPLLPSHCVFSFVFGHGVSFFSGFQGPPVNGCSTASCNFCALAVMSARPSTLPSDLISSYLLVVRVCSFQSLISLFPTMFPL